MFGVIQVDGGLVGLRRGGEQDFEKKKKLHFIIAVQAECGDRRGVHGHLNSLVDDPERGREIEGGFYSHNVKSGITLDGPMFALVLGGDLGEVGKGSMTLNGVDLLVLIEVVIYRPVGLDRDIRGKPDCRLAGPPGLLEAAGEAMTKKKPHCST